VVRVVLGLLLLCAAGARAEAMVIDNSVWESRVVDAHWIAVLECERAGLRVARFRVVESWKGAHEVGQVLTLERGGLVGERFLVIRGAPYRVGPRLSGYLPGGSGPGSCVRRPSTPVQWRRIRVDDDEGRSVALPTRASKLEYAFRSPHKDLAAFKRAVLDLLRQSPAEQERRALLGLARRHVAAGLAGSLLPRLEAATSAQALVRELLTEESLTSQALWRIVMCGGSQGALAALEATPGDPKLLKKLSKELAAKPKVLSEPKPGDRHLSEEDRQQLLRSFYRSLYGREPGRRTFSLELLERDLAQGKLGIRADEEPLGADNYDYVSTLCALYPEQGRVDFLRRLLRAKDPWARVAGAVYLLPHSHTEAHLALERFARLEGEPGAWASLTLARRGHALYAERLLGLKGKTESSARLIARAFVLLSNTAAKAGVPRPPKLDRWNPKPTERAELKAWWTRHRPRLEPHLRDPWLEELAGQRVD
jgi:hypothetical protein